MKNSEIENKKMGIENAKELASLWHSSSSDYSLLSSVMRKYPKNWDGFLNIAIYSENTNVFYQWITRASSELFKGLFKGDDNSQDNRLSILSKFKEDLEWWVENKGLPEDISNLGFKIIPRWEDGSNVESKEMYEEIYEKWCNIWLDSGYIKDEVILNALLIKSILSDNTNIVKKLVNSHGLDINQDITSKNQEYYFNSFFSNKYYNPKTQKMKLGFFVKSEKMAKALSELGFNWDVEVNGNSLREVIQQKSKISYLDSSERKKVIRYIDDTHLNHKKNSTEQVVSLIKNATNIDDIDLALRYVNMDDIQDENGENALHLLAKYAPESLKKYTSKKTKSGLRLMDIPDNDGRYPLDYFFCFASNKVLEKDMQKVTDSCGQPKFKKPNWLEVKMLIVENRATYSGVDSVPMNMWQQKTPEEFKASLKTKRGQKFIKMATNYKYDDIELPPMDKRYGSNFESIYYGMEINKYTNSSGADEFSFFDAADTDSEIELSFLQLALMIREEINFFKKPDIKKLQGQFDALLEKTAKSKIDMAKLKGEMLAVGLNPVRHSDFSTFDTFMCKNFNGWKDIEIVVERKRLSLVVNKDNLKSNHKILEQSCL